MLAATAVLTCMHASVRHISDGMHPFEITFFRNLFGLVAILPLAVRAGLASMKSRQPGLQLLRSGFGLAAMLTWFYGLSVVPIAQATALSFTSVIFGSIGAAIILGERMRLRRWSAVVAGFVGTLVILRPGLATADPAALIVLLSSLCWAGALLTVKRLSSTDSVVCIVTWNSILLTLLSLPVALPVWVTPNGEQLLWLLVIGVLATLGHLAMTGAFKASEATVVFPVDYMRLVWASVIGYLAFSEIPDLWTWLGGTIIFASTTYIAYREAALRRAGRPGA
ncbi:MAG: EamA family transporter [Gammaproteobacteria bacterium]|nr:EamA family transporter [Gammaproteobacteria bacterium]NIM74031.1 EamA family transporter [Gammaproteobacteria bacterium]NIN38913.1 EamA family transporter [Gammaproteobacteria bacterium]NIO25806.1 EamA family transporter [Gammaproteobacteria bacterium]NIO66437.1 EamA family transporter [Gammaproteobacteria bacterium]